MREREKRGSVEKNGKRKRQEERGRIMRRQRKEEGREERKGGKGEEIEIQDWEDNSLDRFQIKTEERENRAVGQETKL